MRFLLKSIPIIFLLLSACAPLKPQSVPVMMNLDEPNLTRDEAKKVFLSTMLEYYDQDNFKWFVHKHNSWIKDCEYIGANTYAGKEIGFDHSITFLFKKKDFLEVLGNSASYGMVAFLSNDSSKIRAAFIPEYKEYWLVIKGADLISGVMLESDSNRPIGFPDFYWDKRCSRWLGAGGKISASNRFINAWNFNAYIGVPPLSIGREMKMAFKSEQDMRRTANVIMSAFPNVKAQ